MSSAVKAIRYLLANNAGLIAQVPAARISAGILPQGTALPAISITLVSNNYGQQISSQSSWNVSRVQVTVIASTYVQQAAIMALVKAAAPRTRGTINGVAVESIIREGEGPDFTDADSGFYMQSIDYIVQFNE